MCTDTRIASISDFVSLVCSLNSGTNMSTPIRIHELLFRGQSTKSMSCCPELPAVVIMHANVQFLTTSEI